MKFDGEIMEILAAYDPTGSLRAAAELTGCWHHTVARHVAARDAGRPIAEPAYGGRVTDPFLPKMEEWVEASRGKIRADTAHEKLVASDTTGRTGRRGGRSRRSVPPTGSATSACIGRGSPSLASGCNTTSATGRSSTAARRCCSSRGWRECGSGS